jgi:predicted DNA-binding helix-hairpin-helix protein
MLTTKTIFIHKIDYYTNNKLVKSLELTELNETGIFHYWNNLIFDLKKTDNSCVELDNFISVNKCVRDYDYCVNRIVEKIITV